MTTPSGQRDTPITVLSYGGGQDSSAILYRLLDDRGAYDRYVRGDLLVVLADTGDEHPETYEHVRRVEHMCAARDIHFALLVPAMGYHTDSWRSLRHQYRLHHTIGSAGLTRSCTENLKILPVYRYLSHYVTRRYGYLPRSRMDGLTWYRWQFGKMRVMLGMARGEERRVARADANTRNRWLVDNVERVYPLLAWGWDRADCQAYIRALGQPVPPPSNCMLCHYKSPIELLWTWRHHPEDVEEWMRLERAKLDKFAGRPGRNLAVFGSKTVGEVLADATLRYGHLSDAELDAYRMSHGHMVKSCY